MAVLLRGTYPAEMKTPIHVSCVCTCSLQLIHGGPGRKQPAVFQEVNEQTARFVHVVDYCSAVSEKDY